MSESPFARADDVIGAVGLYPWCVLGLFKLFEPSSRACDPLAILADIAPTRAGMFIFILVRLPLDDILKSTKTHWFKSLQGTVCQAISFNLHAFVSFCRLGERSNRYVRKWYSIGTLLSMAFNCHCLLWI